MAGKKTIKIKENYVPKAHKIQKSRQEMKSSTPYDRKPKSSVKQICPRCQKEIPIDEMPNHIRIELLDPKWKEQKEREISKKRESNLVIDQGSQIASSLKRLSEFRPDIFGGDEIEALRKIEKEKERSKLRESAAWDGHSGSIATTSTKVTKLPENQAEYQMKIAQDQASKEIGPKFNRNTY